MKKFFPGQLVYFTDNNKAYAITCKNNDFIGLVINQDPFNEGKVWVLNIHSDRSRERSFLYRNHDLYRNMLADVTHPDFLDDCPLSRRNESRVMLADQTVSCYSIMTLYMEPIRFPFVEVNLHSSDSLGLQTLHSLLPQYFDLLGTIDRPKLYL